MHRPSERGWWLLLATALAVIVAWPPQQGRSLGLTMLARAVDPANTLPILPPQLAIGMGDDVEAVERRDALVRRYDEMYRRGGFTRWRLEMKVARDPFDPTLERQVLLVFGVIAAFLVWRSERRA